jgi:hypothetical protein
MKGLLLQLKKMAQDENLTAVNIQNAAEQYLLKKIFLSPEEITKLKDVLSGTNSKTETGVVKDELCNH